MGRKAKSGGVSERKLLSWIRGRTRLDPRSVPIGPGDDAAFVKHSGAGILLAVDTIAEGVDFTLDTATPREIGRKALAINLSDLAAMGGTPSWCMASVNLSRTLPQAFARGLYAGLEKLCSTSGCPLVGGDVTVWNGKVVVTVAIGGAPAGRRPVGRGGAKPGDLVLVTGTLGGSILGKHLRFTPRTLEGAWLARHAVPSAMIDVSDGLGVDAAHIAAESGVAIEIDAGEVPISAAARKLAGRDGRSALWHAVGDGEDFELLFTLPERLVAKVIAEKPFKTKISIVGKVARGRGVWLSQSGRKRRRIDAEGYEHVS